MKRENHNALLTLTRRALLTAAVAAALAPGRAAAAPDWKVADSPLLTRWAKDVRPDRVRPEYPRPHFVRKAWQSLNGQWDFAFDDGGRWGAEGRYPPSPSGPLGTRILVPFTYEAALSGIGKGKEIHERVWYRRAFTVPRAWAGKRVLLNFGAVDWRAWVWVNGKEVGSHTGGYAPFSFDITDALKPDVPQEITVAVYDPADPEKGAYQPKGKQLGSREIWYTRTTGIWQTVWLEPVPDLYMESASVLSWVREGGTGVVQVIPSVYGPGQFAVRLRVSREGRTVAEAVSAVSGPRAGDARRDSPLSHVDVPTPALWSPESPALYDVTITLLRDGETVDEVRAYTAFRTVGIANGRLTLNGKPYFYRGILDQGYWPDGILTPPTEAAIKFDVEMTKKLGFNMSRKHVKVEDPRWYYWCDRLGLAVWQDMPSAHAPLHSDKAAQENFTREWREVMETTRNYPCVVHWIPFNENWGDPRAFQDEIVAFTRGVESSRPITDASGWTQRGLTDVIDAHDYSNDLLKQGVPNPVKPKVVGEYGGIALPVPGHTWSSGWGYQSVKDPEGLTRRVRAQTTQLFEAQNLSGFVYTQLTDVEQELNGLLTYDRLLKADAKKVAAIFRGEDRAETGGYVTDWHVLGPFAVRAGLANAENSETNRDALTKLLRAEFVNEERLSLSLLGGPRIPLSDALAAQGVKEGAKTYPWRRAVADGPVLDLVKFFGAQRDNAVAYALAVIDSPRDVRNATLSFGSDDAAAVWLNGKEVWRVIQVRGAAPDDDAVPGLSLRKGRNVLIVKVAQGVGGWGLSARFELPDGRVLR